MGGGTMATIEIHEVDYFKLPRDVRKLFEMYATCKVQRNGTMIFTLPRARIAEITARITRRTEAEKQAEGGSGAR